MRDWGEGGMGSVRKGISLKEDKIKEKSDQRSKRRER